ncbi:MAG: hypothetical protein IJD16_00630 [Desulfovibrio sp.]|nr:hypothetical protein [Desulfovibrio sp.]
MDFNYYEAKTIIRQGIYDKITFKELREKLPGWRKRHLQSIIFDVMAEMGLKNIPFPGMVVRPRLSRKPIPIDSNGMLCIMDLLKEKGFEGIECHARCHVGQTKITLTIKPVSV